MMSSAPFLRPNVGTAATGFDCTSNSPYENATMRGMVQPTGYSQFQKSPQDPSPTIPSPATSYFFRGQQHEKKPNYFFPQPKQDFNPVDTSQTTMIATPNEPPHFIPSPVALTTI